MNMKLIINETKNVKAFEGTFADYCSMKTGLYKYI